MGRIVAFSSASLFAVVLFGCGQRGTMPDASTLDPVDRRTLALVPDDALVVARLDLAAIRRSSAWEAASAHPAFPHDDVVANASKLDRVLVALTPMVAAGGMLEPSAEGPFPSAGTPADATHDPELAPPDAPGDDASPPEDEPDDDGSVIALDEEPIDVATTDEDESLDDEEPSGAPEELAVTGTPTAGPTDGYRRIFGNRIPGFLVVLHESRESTLCEESTRQASGTRRRLGEFELVEKDGLAWFTNGSDLCGATPSSMVARVLRPRASVAPVVARFIAGNDGDLGFFGYAVEGGGSFVRSVLEQTSSTLSASERRFIDWLARVNDILQRGVVGSSAYVSHRDGTVRVESVVDYADPDRAAAHAIVADTARELLQVTGEALAGEVGGEMPASIVERLEIIREDRRVRYRWQVSEATLTALFHSLMSPDANGDERSWLAGMPDGFSFAPPPETTGTALERIEALEPQRAELESGNDANARRALRALVDAYADRGRWEDARALLAVARERSRAVDDPNELGELALLELEMARDLGDEASATTTLDDAIAACEGPVDCTCLTELLVERAAIDLHAGRLDAASETLERAHDSVMTISDGAHLQAIRALLAGARGRPAEARASLAPALELVSHEATDDLSGARQALALAMNELAQSSRVRLDAEAIAISTEDISAALGVDSSEDELSAYARVALETCRLHVRYAYGAAEISCEQAVTMAEEAYGPVHPRVALARVLRAELLRTKRRTAEVTAELARAEAALEGMAATHPLRARIAALRSGRAR